MDASNHCSLPEAELAGQGAALQPAKPMRQISEAVHGAQGLRDVGDSIVLMGKNTMMKRSIRLYCERTGNETWSNLLESLVGNVGLIFTKADLAEVTYTAAHTEP